MTPAEPISRLKLAAILARALHHGQTRRGGEPYINHVERVALAVESEHERVVALLHDTVEDTGLARGDVARLFGARVTRDVDSLTRIPGYTYAEYIVRLLDLGSDDALRVKLSDLADNMRDGPTNHNYVRADQLIRRELQRRIA